MTESTHQLIAFALRLDPAERTIVANAILASLEDSLDEHPTCQVREAWGDEIRNRVADIDSGRVTTIPSAGAWKRMNQMP